MKDELKTYLNKIHKIPDNLLNEFHNAWYHKAGARKEIITHKDSVERYLYFTTKGIQKAYYIKDGKEFNVAFTYPFAFTCIPESFLTQKPSRYSFECLTESEFLRISYADFIGFVEKHHEFESLLRKTLIGTLGGVVNRYHRILTLSIEERFKDFMKNSPQLINQIPHKEIANYLKIDPTNFSKLLNTVRI
ncbi:MAG: Crp/Fnr family transcriptional regulator [Saprospiraceae bacterium]|uniref:Crp/Fnr family transcriptional regulator n=1 Tax=Candidatus Opimibacter skivensis TaxID=2982028 RepID=A0A9D7SRN1_9BACT|nr:Crp/Fnr family transcriptional regulator [Candidatus Opimibacter skivensis]